MTFHMRSQEQKQLKFEELLGSHLNDTSGVIGGLILCLLYCQRVKLSTTYTFEEEGRNGLAGSSTVSSSFFLPFQ